jgi:hypothetical protein
MFLQETLDSALANIRGNTEIIVMLDGYWPSKPIPDHKSVTIVHLTESIGQRAATNMAVRISKAKWVMKLDAHCAVSEGFDVQLMKDIEPDMTMVPRLYNLHAFDWVCKCGERIYQGPTPGPCPKCGGTYQREMVWKPRLNRMSDFMRFDKDLKFQYWREFKRRPEAQGDIVPTMSTLGACWMLSRKRYRELNICDELHGSWGQQGTEIACKSQLSGGRLVTNRRAFYSHMFRTQGGDFGFPFPITGKQVEVARKYSHDLFTNGKWDKAKYPLSWLLERFWPVPGWDQSDLDALKMKEVA